MPWYAIRSCIGRSRGGGLVNTIIVIDPRTVALPAPGERQGCSRFAKRKLPRHAQLTQAADARFPQLGMPAEWVEQHRVEASVAGALVVVGEVVADEQDGRRGQAERLGQPDEERRRRL